MATVFRIEKQKNYTVMSNHHLKNPALSLKAKGLLSQMLSLPDNWDYSLKGLSKINKESIDAIRTAVWELEKAGYIVRSQGHGEHGKFSGIEYIIYETPQFGEKKTDSQEQGAGADVKQEKDNSSAQGTPESLDTKGVSPWLENPTSVENPEKTQSSDSPWLDFPTSDNPTSANPISEQLNINNNKYINILNTHSFNQQDKTLSSEKPISSQEQLDGQTDFTHALEILENNPLGFEELLANCDFDCLPKPAQPLMKSVLKTMYQSKELSIGSKRVSQAMVRERLRLLDGDILQSIYIDYLSADTPDKPIKNRTNYLISCIYNNSVTEYATQNADVSSIGGSTADIVRQINRGALNPLLYLQSDNDAIRTAAERRAVIENSG